MIIVITTKSPFYVVLRSLTHFMGFEVAGDGDMRLVHVVSSLSPCFHSQIF